jgi:hypothetical protein
MSQETGAQQHAQAVDVVGDLRDQRLEVRGVELGVPQRKLRDLDAHEGVQPRPALGVQHDARRGEVPVHHALLVRVHQGVGEIHAQSHRFLEADATFGDQAVAQAATLHVLDHGVGAVLVGSLLEHGGDAGVPNRAEVRKARRKEERPSGLVRMLLPGLRIRTCRPRRRSRARSTVAWSEVQSRSMAEYRSGPESSTGLRPRRRSPVSSRNVPPMGSPQCLQYTPSGGTTFPHCLQ